MLFTKPVKFYRCHCSLCRKLSGTGHNLATIVNSADFDWTAGTDKIVTWQRPQGFRNDFCESCGSTVPNLLRDSPYVWVPAGLLDTRIEMECAGDFYTEDAMPWDVFSVEMRHSRAPVPLSQLVRLLEVPKLKRLNK